MKKKQLKLNDLKVKSFVTEQSLNRIKTIKGGDSRPLCASLDPRHPLCAAPDTSNLEKCISYQIPNACTLIQGCTAEC